MHVWFSRNEDNVSYVLAIGPDAPYWTGAYRLILKVEGEMVTEAQYRDDSDPPAYIERITRLEPEQVIDNMLRSHGSSSQTYVLAFCQALEELAAVDIPARAAYLRCVIAELERMSSHLQAVFAIFDALGMALATATIREIQQQTHEARMLLGGSNNPLDLLTPGGVRRNFDETELDLLLPVFATLNQQLFAFIDQVIDDPRLLARTVDVGVLTAEVVSQYGLTGPVARAAGVETDVRLDLPYAAYANLNVRCIVQEGGDVHARLVVLLLEAFESVKLIDQVLHELPRGEVLAPFPTRLEAGSASVAVEAPRGLLRCRVEHDGYRLSALAFDTPRQIDRLLARTIFVGELLDNVLLVALSTDPVIHAVEMQAEP